MAGIMNQPYGDVPKWLKGADSKSARRRKACGGSNPSISAKKPDTPLGVPGFLTSMGKYNVNQIPLSPYPKESETIHHTKISKKLKLGIDKLIVRWYYIEAVAERHERKRIEKKFEKK